MNLKHKINIIALISLIFFSCKTEAQKDNPNLIKDLLKKELKEFSFITNQVDKYRLQIVYTRIERDKSNNPRLKHYSFRLKPEEYFYPASLVKLPVLALALEKINTLNIKELNSKTSLEVIRKPSNKPLPDENADSDCRHINPTIEMFVKKILLVSNNDAYNHLLSFVGSEKVHKRLRKMNYANTRIITQLSSPCKWTYNRTINGFSFISNSDKEVYSQPSLYENLDLPAPISNMILGKNNFDFSTKNYISIWDMHQILISLIMPNAMPENQRFNIRNKDFDLVRKYMALSPRESEFEDYTKGKKDDEGNEFADAYPNYLFYGNSQKNIENTNIRIFNKVGRAYGFMSDCAYIVDFDNNIEFFLSAVLYPNENDIVGDGKYQYSKIGYPFMKALGRLFYKYEKENPHKTKVDLSSLKKLFN